MATQFVIDMEIALKLKTDMLSIWERMVELESTIDTLVTSSETWKASSSEVANSYSEMNVTFALRNIAKIKMNRYVISASG